MRAFDGAPNGNLQKATKRFAKGGGRKIGRSGVHHACIDHDRALPETNDPLNRKPQASRHREEARPPWRFREESAGRVSPELLRGRCPTQ